MVADPPRPGGARPAVEWNDALVRTFVYDACRRHEHLVAAFPDVTDDDIRTDMLSEVWKEWAKYDPDRGALSTFINTIVQRRLIDLQRKRSRAAARDKVAATDRAEREVLIPDEVIWDAPDVVEVVEGEIVGGDGEPPLVDWLATVYGLCRRRQREYPNAMHQGRRTYTAAQAMACGLLAAKLKYSTRSMVGLFEDRADLRRAMGFVVAPRQKWFVLATRVVRRIATAG